MTPQNKNKLVNWLNESLNDNNIYINNRYGNYYMGKRDIEEYYKYYSDNDIDMEMNDDGILNIINNTPIEDIIKDEELVNINNSIEKYTTNDASKCILIPRNTNRAHVNYLYKRLIDLTSYNNIPIFDKSMKESFYMFCYENSQNKTTNIPQKILSKNTTKNINGMTIYNFDKYINFIWERVFTVYIMDVFNNNILKRLSEFDKYIFSNYILSNNKKLMIE